MAEPISWARLLSIYQNTEWLANGANRVLIADVSILNTLKFIETSERAAYETDISILVDPSVMAVGKIIDVRIGSPQLRLGVLANDWDGLLSSPEARLREPLHYFIKADCVHFSVDPPTESMLRYRAMLKLVDILGRAALFVDVQQTSLIFFKNRRIEVPVRFLYKDLKLLNTDDLHELQGALEGDAHEEQRLVMLADAVLTLAESQPQEDRFIYLAQNADELGRRVREGYKLFASSFSYSKIRGEVEAAQSEYVGRIHKTFADIQGQLLGLPVATVVVATQLRTVRACDVDTWANLAVVAGAWLFALLLLASCFNQWLTLNAIGSDIDRQKGKLDRDYREIKDTFSATFQAIKSRIWWHRLALIFISAIAVTGALFATIAFRSVASMNVLGCLKP